MHVRDPAASLIQQMKIFPSPAVHCSGSIYNISQKTRFYVLNSDIKKVRGRKGELGNKEKKKRDIFRHSL